VSRKNAPNPPPTTTQINKTTRAIRSGWPLCLIGVGDGGITGGVAGGRCIGGGDTSRPAVMGVANCGSESGKFIGPLTASAFTGGKVDRMERSLETVSALGDICVAFDDVRIVASESEDGVNDEPESSVCSAERFLLSTMGMACFKSSGTGKSNACATAAVIAAALEKRFWGSLARPLRRTSDNAGGSFGFSRSGLGGVSRRCCIIMPVRLSPWNGGTPVNTS